MNFFRLLFGPGPTMTRVFRLSVAGLAWVLLQVLNSGASIAGDDILWPESPIRIDRSRQHYQRLPALQKPVDKRVWITVPSRITILDGARFSFDGKTYRIDRIRPISTTRICHDDDGTRWTCGRAAAVLLGNLVRGKRLLCDLASGDKENVLDRCESGTRDVAAEILASGLGRTDAEGILRTAQELARRRQAGLWKNPQCVIDFDHC